MGAKEKYEGHAAEQSQKLHDWLKVRFNLNDVKSDGSNRTKVDLIGQTSKSTLFYSCKNVSGCNTQIHLTSLEALQKALDMPSNIYETFRRWFGSHNEILFETWKSELSVQLSNTEQRRHRIHSNNLTNWNSVLDWLNQNTSNKKLIKLLIQNLNPNEHLKNVNYMIWIHKLQHTIKIIDVEKLIDYISVNCIWMNSVVERGKYTTLWLVDTNTGQRIMHLQMKGSGNKLGDYHGAMFHIHDNWPPGVLIEEESNFYI